MVILPSIRRKYMVSRLPKGATVPMSDCVVTLAADSTSYTGSARTVGVTVTWEGATLTVNTDYTLAYSNNVDIGPATVTVTGMGQFSGSVTKTFYITTSSTPATWQTFDITKTPKNAVAYAYLMDPNAVYERNTRIDPYTIQVLPDGRLHFVGQRQGHAYIWGFEDGHSFEVEHFKSTYDSRSGDQTSAGSEWLSADGTKGVFSYIGGGLYPFTISTPFDLTQRSAFGPIISTENGSTIGMGFSPDGMYFFHKQITGDIINSRKLLTAWNPGDYESTNNVNLDTVMGESKTWDGFCLAPDGSRIVVLANNDAAAIGVHVFAMTTSWDLSTLEYVNGINLNPHTTSVTSGFHYPKSIAINAEGSKMIIFDRAQDSTGYRFLEYDLSA